MLSKIEQKLRYTAEVIAQIKYMSPYDSDVIHRVALILPLLFYISIRQSIPEHVLVNAVSTVGVFLYMILVILVLQEWNTDSEDEEDLLSQPE